mmetsp:Transcript_32716/g.83381  ORF Transcript_32716/g.83381 Transcript_32716/m.83381 type:complete len:200 (-) Transcript_32716:3-602(-)
MILIGEADASSPSSGSPWSVGSQAKATITTSKTFQPDLKKRHGLNSSAISLTTTSIVKMIEMAMLKYPTTGEEAYLGSVSMPASPAAKRMASVTPFWNQDWCATERHRRAGPLMYQAAQGWRCSGGLSSLFSPMPRHRASTSSFLPLCDMRSCSLRLASAEASASESFLSSSTSSMLSAMPRVIAPMKRESVTREASST